MTNETQDRQSLPDEPVTCCVVGAGPVGLTAALCLAANGCPVVIVAPKPARRDEPDTRTAALFRDNVALMRSLGAWAHMETHGAPLAGIRMVDVSGNLLKAPQLLFRAEEAGYPEFGYNVPNAEITAGLAIAAEASPLITWVDAVVADADIASDHVTLRTDGGRAIRAAVTIAADGRNSRLRELAGLTTGAWDYDQVAITSRFRHSLPHEGISTELHYDAGPCTCVPLPGNESSLVWMERPAIARRLLADGAELFMAMLRERFSDLLGTITDVAAPGVLALKGVIADRFGGTRVLLAGETAHAFPPIGAQGLNLGIRDAAEAAGCVLDALAAESDPGSETVMRTYHSRRWADIQARTAGVNALNASLTGGWPFLATARGLGLHVVSAVPALKRQLIRQGMSGLGSQPTLISEAVAAEDGLPSAQFTPVDDRPGAEIHSA